MERKHQIYIILSLIISSLLGESGGLSSSSPVAEPHRGPSSSSSSCHFPQRWEGGWFQSGVHQTITINPNTINTKGNCLESDGEKYLVFNEKENCYRCLVFHEKHHNLIQYKETFCVTDRTSIRNLCSTITGDANLFAMFRLDAQPIECPFRAPMTFTYNRGHGECRNPVSNIESCVHPTTLLFNYQACPDVPGTESTTEELQCLASWKEGSSRYLIGLIQYRHHASYEERFRCFVYEKVKKGSTGFGLLGQGVGFAANIRSSPLTFNSSTSSSSLQDPSRVRGQGQGQGQGSSPDLSESSPILYRISQSGDATCNGLTPTEGSRTMTFRRAQPIQTCYFPSWLQVHPRWHTLDQRSTFVFNSTVLRMVNGSASATPNSNPNFGSGSSQSNFPNANPSLAKFAVCSQIVENPSPNEYTLVLHVSTAQCRNGYICSRIVRREGHIVEMQMGHLTRQPDEACHPINFPKNLPYVTLTSSNSVPKRCPSLGHFGITSLTHEGRLTPCQGFSVGCSRTMEFSRCDKKPELIEYACHGWWEEDGINYVITALKSSARRKFCFIYRDIESPLSLRKDFLGKVMQFSSLADSCRRDVSPGTQGFLAFNVTSKGPCDISGSSIRTPPDLWALSLLPLVSQMLRNLSFLRQWAS